MNKEIDKKFDFYEYLTNEILCRFEKTIEMDEIEREKLYYGNNDIVNKWNKIYFYTRCTGSF